MNDTLITKYRPQSFDEVLGNEAVVNALVEAIKESNCPHAYLLTGPSGIGKTTIARIIAKEVKADILELDAASYSGVDDMRKVVELAAFRPITKYGKQFVILDECHALSKAAWKPLLKLLEEPPNYMYFALCTTEIQAVPDTIRTRCYLVALRTLKVQEIEDLLITVCEIEGWNIEGSTLTAIVQAATGQPRKALSILHAGHAAKNREELAQIISGVESESSAIIELCRHLVSGKRNWKYISSLLEKVDDSEEAIAAATGYISVTLTRSEEAQAKHLYKILESLMVIRNGWNRKAQLVAAVGQMMWGNQVF